MADWQTAFRRDKKRGTDEILIEDELIGKA